MTAKVFKRLREFFADLDSSFDEKAEEKKSASWWNEFLQQIAREIETVMRAEMLQPPGEPTYIPPEYIIFISPEDDAGLRGDKRVGFIRGLRNITAQRANEIVKGRAQTDRLLVELRVDGSLSKGQFHVKPIWERDEQGTAVLSRRPVSSGLREACGETVILDEEQTRVLSHSPLKIEVRRKDSEERTVREFPRPEIAIGRGGKTVEVDLALPGDLEISRLHAVLQRTEAHEVKICARGRNPLIVQGRKLQAGDETVVHPGEEIQMGAYVLRIIEDE